MATKVDLLAKSPTRAAAGENNEPFSRISHTKSTAAAAAAAAAVSRQPAAGQQAGNMGKAKSPHSTSKKASEISISGTNVSESSGNVTSAHNLPTAAIATAAPTAPTAPAKTTSDASALAATTASRSSKPCCFCWCCCYRCTWYVVVRKYIFVCLFVFFLNCQNHIAC